MKYCCKIAYRDRVKPTTRLDEVTLEDLKLIVGRLLEELSTDQNMKAIYIGKLEPEE
jgi:hypothetical protein